MNRKEKVYAFLHGQAKVPLTEDEIAAMLDVPKKDRAELRLILEELYQSGQIAAHKGRYYVKKTLSDEAVLSGILEAHAFPLQFPPAALEAASALPSAVRSVRGRTDFRSLLTFTIDGKDARDFDDAISIEETENGFRLYVHIADVTHYVKQKDAIDIEAFSRGTSCYLPSWCVPMLPPALSNGICSLNPGVDRLTLTTIIDLSPRGDITGVSICEAVICSDFRLVYEEVSNALVSNTPPSSFAPAFPSLQLLETLCRILKRNRAEKGSIDLHLPEPSLVMGTDGQVTDIVSREDGIANQIIEECMVLCNRVLADFMFRRGAPFVYRVHEAPDAEKLLSLQNALASFGLSIPGKFSGKKAGALLEEIEDETQKYVVSNLLLRTMMKARYSHENTGHFGLALSDYCHFTSPIRRYPDLLCHRIVKALLKGQDVSRFSSAVKRTAPFASTREEAAAEAEREAARYLMCRYMEGQIGAEFTGVIASVLDFGFFVTLPNLCEGLVHVKDLEDDYYIYDEKTLTLSGRQSGRVYRLGDRVTVQLVRVDSALSRMDFILKETVADGKNNCTK